MCDLEKERRLPTQHRMGAKALSSYGGIIRKQDLRRTQQKVAMQGLLFQLLPRRFPADGGVGSQPGSGMESAAARECMALFADEYDATSCHMAARDISPVL